MVYKIRNKGFASIWAMGANNARSYPAKKTKVNVDLSSHVTLQV
jgi:hypothetical protein